MQTHEDSDFIRQERDDFMRRLRERADQCVRDKASQITTGKDGEEELASWKHGGVQVRHLPDDEQGILRISVGGGSEIVPLDYCVIRGSVWKCIALLERSIKALRAAP